jgi:hypothetical protein
MWGFELPVISGVETASPANTGGRCSFLAQYSSIAGCFGVDRPHQCILPLSLTRAVLILLRKGFLLAALPRGFVGKILEGIPKGPLGPR